MPTPYAPDSYVASGSQTDFQITFAYLHASHLYVTKDAVEVTSANYTLVTGGTVLRLNVACAGGETVVISRVTPIGADYRLIDYTAGAGVSEVELDTADQQLHYALEELEYNTDAAALAIALAAASAAALAAETAQDAAEAAALDAQSSETDAEIAQGAAQGAQALAEFALAGQYAIARGHVSGFTISRTGTTTLSISAGSAMSEDVAQLPLVKTAATSIDITTGSAASPLQGGMSSNRAVSTWYHVFVIRHTASGAISATLSTSVTAPTLPAGYGSYKRVGSIKLNATGSGEIVPFIQHDDDFIWTDPANLPLDNNQTATDFTGGVSVSLTNAPPGVRTVVTLDYYAAAHGAGAAGVWYGGDVTSAAPSETAAPLVTFGNGGSGEFSGQVQLLTDASSPPVVKYRTEGDTSTDMRCLVRGWRDARATV